MGREQHRPTCTQDAQAVVTRPFPTTWRQARGIQRMGHGGKRDRATKHPFLRHAFLSQASKEVEVACASE
eukprot:scaffold867_cov317-Pavlova_lutheri.AAC.42